MCCRKLQAWSRHWKLLFFPRSTPVLCDLPSKKTKVFFALHSGACPGKFNMYCYFLSNFIVLFYDKKGSGQNLRLIKAISTWWELDEDKHALYKSELPLADTLARTCQPIKSICLFVPPSYSLKPILHSKRVHTHTCTHVHALPGKRFQRSCCLVCLVLKKNEGLNEVLPCCLSLSPLGVLVLCSSTGPFLLL